MTNDYWNAAVGFMANPHQLDVMSIDDFRSAFYSDTSDKGKKLAEQIALANADKSCC